VPKFNKGDRVRVRLTSHSPYRGQIGVVDDNPSSYSHPSTSSSDFWYTVRFEYKGLRPAVRFMEEELEAVTDEITREETPAAVELARRSRSDVGNQIVQVSTKRKYFLTALISVLVLAGILIAFNVTGINNNSPTPSGFSSTPINPPLLTEGSSNGTTKLAFATELVEATAGSALPIQPAVKIVDADGNIVTTSTAPVTLTVNNNRAILYGPTTVNAVNGVATFTDLSIGLAGFNYTLTASSPGLTGGISNSFDVKPGTAVFLAFLQEPSASGLASRFSTKVAIVDTFINIVTDSKAEVTLSITPGSGAPGAVLSGTTTQKTIDGVATFSYLSISPENSDYKLTATSPGLISATSYSFNPAEIAENNAQ
jgi:hypothetical protein